MFWQCLTSSKWTISLISTSKVIASKTSKISIFILSDHRDCSTIGFFFHRNNQTLLHGWLHWKMKWTHEIYSRLFTLDLTWNCRRLLEAKKFSRSPGQFKWVTREQDIAYPSRNSKNGIMSQVAELFRRPRTILKILWFIGN